VGFFDSESLIVGQPLRVARPLERGVVSELATEYLGKAPRIGAEGVNEFETALAQNL